MTAGSGRHHQPPLPQPRPHTPVRHGKAAQSFFDHSKGLSTNTSVVIADSLRSEYPDLHLSVVPSYSCDILSYAAAGEASLAPMDKEQDRVLTRFYLPPARRLGGGRGALATDIDMSKFLVDWQGKEFILYIVKDHKGNDAFGFRTEQFLLSSSIEVTNNFLITAGDWGRQLRNEVLLYDGGFWQKSSVLWDAVQQASWDDVILDSEMKKAIIDDVETFFDNPESYERLRVPWKRGLIFYGPPGNGKTISLKATMHTLYNRKKPIPTLYVKTLASFGGPEYSINQIFSRARREAPCFLIFEDLDSVVTDEVRSYFLNAVDGIERNDGILMIGSTNHLERLDPGISKRPSRFDRKYLFANPSEDERVQYMQYWQHKLDGVSDVPFPSEICTAAAKITDGFSFAYIQEAMVAALLSIARGDYDDDDGDEDDNDSASAGCVKLCLECMRRHPKPTEDGTSCDRNGYRLFRGFYDWLHVVDCVDGEDSDLETYVLWRAFKKQVRTLREELGEQPSRHF